ncbi:MAG TPA: isochorismatase family protein [Candidatus Limnocylindrales bacterium]|nr:isochorismatase family protein [Candidatus Limnocylindrales bacterium]
MEPTNGRPARPWDGLYGADELAAWEQGGYGARAGLGERPAVLIIDVIRAFTGYEGEDHLESVKTFRQSCGPYAWKSIPYIQRLLAAGRARGFPVIYTRAALLPPELRGARRRKNRRVGKEGEAAVIGHEYPPEIAPAPGDLIIEKTKPSVFFGTPLLNHLQMYEVDHLLVAGTTTSGCVRASIYDAFSYNFSITIPYECVFDRFQTSHRANLFDMNSKFADVMSMDELEGELDAAFPVPVAEASAG